MEDGSNLGIRCGLFEEVMAYDYSTPPPGYHFYENKPSAYDYSTPTPGYATYGFKRNDATSPSVKHPYPYTTKGQHANEPSRRGHTRQASYSSVASLNPDSTRPKFQGADLSPEVAPDKSYEKDTEEANNPFAFSPGQLNKFLNPKPMASWKDLGGLDDLEQGPQTDVAGVKYSSVEPLATKNHPSKPRPVDHPSRSLGPAKPLWDPNNDDPTTRRTARRDRQSGHVNEPSKNDQWQSIIARIKQKSKENHDSSLSKIYQDQPYNRPMPNVPKTISPKDALLDFDDAEEDAMTSLFPQNTVREESMTPGVGGPSRKVSPGLPRPATFKRQEGEKRERLTPVESPSRVGSLLRTKQGLVGFANGSSIAAMADTGSRKNVISASYAKKLDLSIEGLPSTFAIGNSRKIQSLGKYTHSLIKPFKW